MTSQKTAAKETKTIPVFYYYYYFFFFIISVIYTTYNTNTIIHLLTQFTTITKIYNYESPLRYQQKYITIQLLTHYLQYNVITGVTYNNTIASLTL